MKSTQRGAQEEKYWQLLSEKMKLSDNQLDQFRMYSKLLQEWNKKINLTAITDPEGIVREHFLDSLMISSYVDFSSLSMISDIGTGAGFPGIPLKIKFPHLKVVLIEVVQKKITFLQEVMSQLNLDYIIVSPLDWRTFLRQTDYHIELFLARASLSLNELIRMFKPSCVYHNAKLAYWASLKWQLPAQARPYFDYEVSYSINTKRRRYIFFKLTN